MTNIKRRHFLQFAGSTLATLGLSQLDVMQRGNDYARVLAQNTRRKFALLVGINKYPFGNELRGCLMDVELQKNLLIHRFGFNEKDILTLTDEQATRSGILKAFEEHLINKAQPGDVVVFHFSGHGSQVYDADCDFKDEAGNCLNSTFIPYDNNLSFKQRESGGEVNDIMGHTLFLLMYALKTENVTVVLDSCHSGGGKRGNLIVRAAPGGKQLRPSQAEIEYQRQWLRKLNLQPKEVISLRRAGIAKGVVIASAKRQQLAADAVFDNFKAGAFTYAMTQYLWQETGNEQLGSALARIARTATQKSSTSQEPEYEAKSGSNYSQRPIYFINKTTPPADAAIASVDGDRIDVWLGGINSESLKAFDSEGIFTILDAQGKEAGTVKLEPNSRNKLLARGKLVNGKAVGSLQPGVLLQEQVRGIPVNPSLKIGLDPSLDKDTDKATLAIKAINRVQVFPVQQGIEVAYLIGRITQDNLKFQKPIGSDMPPVGSIGLFTPALELIPGSFGKANEPVEDAVTRLKPKFKSLLAAHIAKTILNPDSSRLNVTASMSRADGSCNTYATVSPVRGGRSRSQAPCQPNLSSLNALKLPIGTPIDFKIENGEETDLYVSVLVIDPEGEMTVIFPNKWAEADDATRIMAGATRQIPQIGIDNFQFLVAKPLGTVEVLVIASRTPLRNTLLALRQIATRGGRSRGPQNLRGDEPLKAVDALFEDVQQDTSQTSGTLGKGVMGVNTSQLAAMSITFQSVEKN